MNNFTHQHGKKDNAMTKFNLKGGKALALAAFFLFFTLGAMAQQSTGLRAVQPPAMQIGIQYYPDANYPHSAFVKVYWGTDWNDNYFDFESGSLPSYWQNDAAYPWVVASPDTLNDLGYEGHFCIMSGNAGAPSSSSTISATINFVENGSISFIAGCFGEGSNYDVCQFLIDDEVQFSNGEIQQPWNTYSYDVTQGTHTFSWTYIKDSSVDSDVDGFFVDNVSFTGFGGGRSETPSYPAYNLYRFNCDFVGSSEPTPVAVNLTGNQYIDNEWGNLPEGDYQYGVENAEDTDAGITWSDCLSKTTVDYFEVTATVNNQAAGTVSGAGTYSYGQTCTLEAIANTGYYFTHWTVNNDTINPIYSADYNFTVTEDVDFVANFEQKGYDVWVYAEPESGGTVEFISNNDYYIHCGDTVTLSASPNYGYTFVKWTARGTLGRGVVELSTDSIYTFVVDTSFLRQVYANTDSYESGESGDEFAIIEFVASFVEGIGDCLRPSDLTATEVGPNFATLSWTENGVAESWYLFYHPAIPTPTVIPDSYIEVTENPYTLSDLYPNTPYQVFVVPSCGVDDTIPNSIVSSETLDFTTLDACPVPINVSVSDITGTTASVDWHSYNESYYVQLGTPSFMATTDFNNGIPAEWVNNTNYAWTVVDGHMQSGNAGSSSSTSSISATITFPNNGFIEFDAECMGEGTIFLYDHCDFFIDTTNMFSAAANIDGWNHYSFEVTAGEHTFTWSYTKDSMLDPEGDYFAVDNVVIRSSEITWGNSIPAENSPITLSNLTPNTGYGVHVKGVCGETDTEWSESVFFTTTNAASYQITASTNPTGAGVITGTGTYNYDASCTLSVTANEGYTFTNWTKNGEVVSTDATFSFLVSESASYVANFSLNSYTLTINYKYADGSPAASSHTESVNYNVDYSVTSPSITGYTPDLAVVTGTMGTQNVTVDVTYNINSYTLTVNYKYADGSPAASTHTESVNYNVDYSVTSPSITGYTPDLAVVTGTMGTQNVTVDVTYTINSYQITATADPSVGGTVTGGGTYNHFENVTLTATANEGYTFIGWADGVQDAQRTVTVTGPAEYVANFQLNSYQITATAYPSVGGNVTGGGTYNHFETCTLTATPNAYYEFTSWTKNGQVVSTNATYSFTVTEGGTYIANFTRVNHQITAMVNPAESGNVSGAGSYAHGSTCTLTATANTGYAFSSWTKNGAVVSSNPAYSFTVTEDATYIANFTPVMYTITVSADPSVGGTASGNGTYLYNENCTVNAMPNAGYTFTNWTNNGTVVSTEQSYTFTVTQDANLVAHFTQDHYTVTVSVDPQQAGTATGGGSFTYGETCTLTATPNTGYAFVNWTKDGTVVSSNANYSFTVTNNGDYVANFAVARYTLTVLAEPAEGGHVVGGGNYDYGHVTTLRATANEGYEFVNWTKDGAVVSSNAIYSVVVREDAEYVAHFLINTFEIKANTNPDNSGTITGEGYYNYGETCTLTVTPNNDYEFINWTLNGQVVSETESFSFIVTEAADYVAHLQYVEGVAEQSGITISLFPNPAKSKLTIEASESVNLLEIYTINGALVYRQNNCSDKIEINVSNYAIGTYMIRLTTDSTVEIRRFVKE